MNRSELVTLRPANADDLNFIMSTFLLGLYYGDSPFSEIPKSIFMSQYHQLIEALLASPKTMVYMACLRDDTDTVLGYSILDKSLETAHWVFVKKAWRGIGLARMLVPESTKVVTHLTKVGLAIIRKKGLTFNPFLV